MRKLALVLAGMMVSGLAMAQGTIQSSAHDFSGDAWSGGEICIACHTPHNADTTVSLAPLWNHTLTTNAAYTLYSTATLNAAVAQPTTANGISRLCMSCHDGTVALDSFGQTPGNSTFLTSADPGYVGTDISNDHPVSFTYNTALSVADGAGVKDPAGTPAVAALLFNNSLECASCHDVHNSTGIDKLLRVSNAASALCLTCHNK